MFTEVAEIDLVAARLGKCHQLLKTRVILILNFTGAPCDYPYEAEVVNILSGELRNSLIEFVLQRSPFE